MYNPALNTIACNVHGRKEDSLFRQWTNLTSMQRNRTQETQQTVIIVTILGANVVVVKSADVLSVCPLGTRKFRSQLLKLVQARAGVTRPETVQEHFGVRVQIRSRTREGISHVKVT